MRKTLTILGNSLRLTMQELRVNKLRTTLSLIGIAFGIFCIIGVLATVNSLEQNIQNNLKNLGTNSIYIDKWQYAAGPDQPWWKFVNRPNPKFQEVNYIRQRSSLAKHISYIIANRANIEYENSVLQQVNFFGFTEEQLYIQPLTIQYGRYISESEFANANGVMVMGYDLAENLFGTPGNAIGKEVQGAGRKAVIIGVIKKMGQTIGGWDYDKSVIMAYRFCRQLFIEDNSRPFIIVMGKENVSSTALSDELTGIMRSVRKLSPKSEDNFALNDINAISDVVSSFFVKINIGGWAIGALSLIVGAFGIANIMFVTVKERTSIIGLKKAIGAKKRSILLEFLLEAAIICIMGGLIGLLLVYILTLVLTGVFHFPIFISPGILSLAIFICIAIGILAGIIPASAAARLDPVVAIRSK